MSKPPTILEKIYAQRALDVEVAKNTHGTTPDDISKLLSMHLAPPLIPFVDRLRKNPSNVSRTESSETSPSPSLMAEIKRASPSKGPIALTTPVSEQALTYALAGASVISVLTEPHWFKGSLHDMLMVRQSVSSIPDRPAILRKEFILDEYQIAEARLYGADTVLLIVAMMNDELLTRLYRYSISLGMEPLVEVNNADEMRRALDLGAKVIGVNNRNLHDFNVDMSTTSRLVDMVKDRDVILCALSGISTPQDVRTYKDQGVKAVLVGESLMRAKDTGAFIRELLDWPNDQEQETQPSSFIIKASGVTTTEQAQKLRNNGASMLGFTFDPTLVNSITLDHAKAIRDLFPKSSSNSVLELPEQSDIPWFHSHIYTISSQCASRSPLLVGHFTTHHSHTLAFILEAISVVSLDLVQFDGPLPAEWARFIPVPVIRRFASPLLPPDTVTEKPASANAAATTTTTTTTTAIVPGINDSSQINRPGLHSLAIIDLTVASGSNTVYVPSGSGPSSAGESGSTPTPDAAFRLPVKDQSNITPGLNSTLKIAEAKSVVKAGEQGGKWMMPLMVTAGSTQVRLSVIYNIGAWGIDIEAAGNENYIRGLLLEDK